jgi:hypothetical protein
VLVVEQLIYALIQHRAFVPLFVARIELSPFAKASDAKMGQKEKKVRL